MGPDDVSFDSRHRSHLHECSWHTFTGAAQCTATVHTGEYSRFWHCENLAPSLQRPCVSHSFNVSWTPLTVSFRLPPLAALLALEQIVEFVSLTRKTIERSSLLTSMQIDPGLCCSACPQRTFENATHTIEESDSSSDLGETFQGRTWWNTPRSRICNFADHSISHSALHRGEF